MTTDQFHQHLKDINIMETDIDAFMEEEDDVNEDLE